MNSCVSLLSKIRLIWSQLRLQISFLNSRDVNVCTLGTVLSAECFVITRVVAWVGIHTAAPHASPLIQTATIATRKWYSYCLFSYRSPLSRGVPPSNFWIHLSSRHPLSLHSQSLPPNPPSPRITPSQSAHVTNPRALDALCWRISSSAFGNCICRPLLKQLCLFDAPLNLLSFTLRVSKSFVEQFIRCLPQLHECSTIRWQISPSVHPYCFGLSPYRTICALTCTRPGLI